MPHPGSGSWDEEVDLLVIGAGAGGMTAALVGGIEGMRTVICEKTGMVGGLTSTSAGTIWIPGTRQSAAAGLADSVDDARTFLAAVVDTERGRAERAAFLESGPVVLDYLEARSEVRFTPSRVHPDYIRDAPGAAYGGRALTPVPFDGRRLGRDFMRVRPPRPEFMVLGGMMVNRTDIPFLLNPFRSLESLMHVSRMLLRHATDRLRYPRGSHLVMGNALVARLLFSLREHKVPIRFDTSLESVVVHDGVVRGARVATPSGIRAIRVRRGLVLATGGIGWNADLRSRLFPQETQGYSLAPESNTGDGIVAGLQCAAGLDTEMKSPGLWMPCSRMTREDGRTSVWPHIILDRSKPGLIAVNSSGQRFVNEGDSYHDFCVAMLKANATAPSVPSHLVCDASFIRDYGIGLVRPGSRDLKRFIASGYLIEGRSIQDLAARIGVDAPALERTIERHNGFARTGVDEDFGRGTSDLNRVYGDPTNVPNPCLRPIGPGPFFAVAVWPADLASSAGLCGDSDGRVLGRDGTVIDGLYACGNDLGSIFRGTYPGPGTTLGPALVFGWRAAIHARARQPLRDEDAR